MNTNLLSNATFGFGVEVDFSDKDPEFDEFEFLEEVLEDTDELYDYFVYGNAYDDERIFCIYIPQDILFLNGYNIEDHVSTFEAFLKENNIKYKSAPAIIGGLRIS